MLSAQLASGDATFLLLEDANDLLLAEPSFHLRILSFLRVKLSQLSVYFSGATSLPCPCSNNSRLLRWGVSVIMGPFLTVAAVLLGVAGTVLRARGVALPCNDASGA
jgi:hypothetical protein